MAIKHFTDFTQESSPTTGAWLVGIQSGALEEIKVPFRVIATGLSYYPLSNPSGYITSGDISNFITTGQTGNFITSGMTGNFVDSSQTGNFGGGGISFIKIEASEFIPRATEGCGIDPQETLTNLVNRDYISFDAAANTYAQYWFNWPENWNSAKLTFFWSAIDTGNVAFAGQMRIYSDGESVDQAFGEAQFILDSSTGANLFWQSDPTPEIIPSGTIGANKRTCLQIYRDTTNTGESLAENALLESVLVEKYS